MTAEAALGADPLPSPAPRISLWQIFLQFFHFGFMAWGGPIVQLALIRSELIDKKCWVKNKKFNRVLAIYQLLPGSEITKMSIFLGIRKRGRLGGMVAGLGFILPGFLITLAFSFIYHQWGNVQLRPLFSGIQPAIAALIIYAVIAIKGRMLKQRYAPYAVAFYAVCAIVMGAHFLLVIFISGALFMLWKKNRRFSALALGVVCMAGVVAYHYAVIAGASSALPHYQPPSLGALWMTGLKTGSFSFGGAYTTVALFQEYMVDHLWLSRQQLIDGVAVVSLLPTPVTTLAVFLGFQVKGLAGALVMGLAAFIPSFLLALFGQNIVKRIIKYKEFRPFLQGMIAGVMGLFIITAIEITLASVTDWKRAVIAGSVLAVLYCVRSHFIIPLAIVAAGVAGVLFL